VLRARGDVVAFLDDDDRFHPGKLRRVREVFTDPSVVYYHHGFRRVNAQGTPVRSVVEVRPVRAPVDLPLSRSSAAWTRRMGGFYNTSSIAVRRSALLPQLSTLRQITNAQDFSMLLLSDGRGTAVIDGTQVLTDFRTHASQGTHYSVGPRVGAAHARFLQGTIGSFEVLEKLAPTPGAREFSACRTVSYGTLLWATVGTTVAAYPRPHRKAVRSVVGNLREKDFLSAAVLASLSVLAFVSRDWAARFYLRLMRVNYEAIGAGTVVSSASPGSRPHITGDGEIFLR
jgi:hypothetical protein